MAKPKLTKFHKEVIKDALPHLLKSMGFVVAGAVQWQLEHIGWKTEKWNETVEKIIKQPFYEWYLDESDNTWKRRLYYTDFVTTEVIERTKIKFTRLKTPETSDLENTPVVVPILSMLYRLGDLGVDTAEYVGDVGSNFINGLAGLFNPLEPVGPKLLKMLEG